MFIHIPFDFPSTDHKSRALSFLPYRFVSRISTFPSVDFLVSLLVAHQVLIVKKILVADLAHKALLSGVFPDIMFFTSLKLIAFIRHLLNCNSATFLFTFKRKQTRLRRKYVIRKPKFESALNTSDRLLQYPSAPLILYWPNCQLAET